RHKLRRLLHGSGRLRRVRLAVTDDIANKHRICLLVFDGGVAAIISGFAVLAKQNLLCGGAAEGACPCGLVTTLLVEAETLAMNFEQTLGGFPVLSFTAHAFAEDTRIQLTV